MSRPPRVNASDPALRALPGARAGVGGEVSGGGGVVGIGGVGSCHGPGELTGKGDGEQGDRTRRAARRGQLLGRAPAVRDSVRAPPCGYARGALGSPSRLAIQGWPGAVVVGVMGRGRTRGEVLKLGFLTSPLRKVASRNPTCSRFQTAAGAAFPRLLSCSVQMPGPNRGSGST